ncbi:MAG: hypothetical protein ACQEQU_07470 [Spirochaetota bacterium]
MRKLCIVFVLLGLSVAALPAADFELQIYPNSYFTWDASYETGDPRVQYGGGITTGIIIPVISPVSLTAHIGLSTVFPAGPYGQMMQKGFTSHFAGAGFDVAVSDIGGVQLTARAKQSTYYGTFTRFTHLSYTVTPYVHLFSKANSLSLSLPVTYDRRRDTDHAFSAGIGLRLSYQLGGVAQ